MNRWAIFCRPPGWEGHASIRTEVLGEEIRPEVTEEAGGEDEDLCAPAGEFEGAVTWEGAADEEDGYEGDDKGEEFFFRADVAAIGHEGDGEKILGDAQREGQETFDGLRHVVSGILLQKGAKEAKWEKSRGGGISDLRI
jgi:hypothetical protein